MDEARRQMDEAHRHDTDRGRQGVLACWLGCAAPRAAARLSAPSIPLASPAAAGLWAPSIGLWPRTPLPLHTGLPPRESWPGRGAAARAPAQRRRVPGRSGPPDDQAGGGGGWRRRRGGGGGVRRGRACCRARGESASFVPPRGTCNARAYNAPSPRAVSQAATCTRATSTQTADTHPRRDDLDAAYKRRHTAHLLLLACCSRGRLEASPTRRAFCLCLCLCSALL